MAEWPVRAGGVLEKTLIEAYFFHLQTSPTARGRAMAPATAKATWGSFCVLVEVLVKEKPVEGSNAKKVSSGALVLGSQRSPG